jgi:hypothetical protein
MLVHGGHSSKKKKKKRRACWHQRTTKLKTGWGFLGVGPCQFAPLAEKTYHPS